MSGNGSLGSLKRKRDGPDHTVGHSGGFSSTPSSGFSLIPIVIHEVEKVEHPEYKVIPGADAVPEEDLDEADEKWAASRKPKSKKKFDLRTEFPSLPVKSTMFEWILYDVPMWKHITTILKQVTDDEAVQWMFYPAQKRVYMQRMDTANTSTAELCLVGDHLLLTAPRASSLTYSSASSSSSSGASSSSSSGASSSSSDTVLDQQVYAISNKRLAEAVAHAKPTDRLRMFVSEGKSAQWNVWAESLIAQNTTAKNHFPILDSDAKLFDTEPFLTAYNVMFEVEAVEWNRWITSLKKTDSIIHIRICPDEKQFTIFAEDSTTKCGMTIEKNEATFPIRILVHHKHPTTPLPNNVICTGQFAQGLCQMYSAIYRVGKPGDKIKISMTCEPYERPKTENGRPVYQATNPLLLQYELWSDRHPQSFDNEEYIKVGWARFWIAPKIADGDD